MVEILVEELEGGVSGSILGNRGGFPHIVCWLSDVAKGNGDSRHDEGWCLRRMILGKEFTNGGTNEEQSTKARE